jgi:hypothetical protein
VNVWPEHQRHLRPIVEVDDHLPLPDVVIMHALNGDARWRRAVR